MKFLNHPVHVMLIHFPAALLPMDLLLSAWAWYEGNGSINEAAFFCLAAGVLIGYLAIITGLIDLAVIPKERKTTINAALLHGLINGSVILIYTFILYKEWKMYPGLAMPSTGMLAFKGILILTLLTGNYFGGKLIYKYHLGIEK